MLFLPIGDGVSDSRLVTVIENKGKGKKKIIRNGPQCEEKIDKLPKNVHIIK